MDDGLVGPGSSRLVLGWAFAHNRKTAISVSHGTMTIEFSALSCRIRSYLHSGVDLGSRGTSEIRPWDSEIAKAIEQEDCGASLLSLSCSAKANQLVLSRMRRVGRAVLIITIPTCDSFAGTTPSQRCARSSSTTSARDHRVHHPPARLLLDLRSCLLVFLIRNLNRSSVANARIG